MVRSPRGRKLLLEARSWYTLAQKKRRTDGWMSNRDTRTSQIAHSHETARASYNRLSRWYDMLAGQSEARLVESALDRFTAAEGENILEVGFGTGTALVALAHSVGNTGAVFGVDISDGMLTIASTKAQRAGISERVHLQRNDAENLPYEDNCFDGIFMSFTLELFDPDEIPLILHECHRVLRKDGRICVVAMAKKESPNLITRLYEWGHKTFPKTIDCRPIFVHHWLESAHFSVIDTECTSVWGLPVQIVVAKRDNP